MSVKDEKCIGNNRDENGAMDEGVNLLEHRRNEILEEARVRVEAIATVMRRRRLEWFTSEQLQK